MEGNNESPVNKKIKEGLAFFNKGDFYDAHEVLEYAWRIDKSPTRELLQGLIQFSVGCYHAKRKNWIGAVRTLDRAETKIAPYQNSATYVNVHFVLSQLENLKARIIQIKNLHLEGVEVNEFPKIYFLEELTSTPDQNNPGGGAV